MNWYTYYFNQIQRNIINLFKYSYDQIGFPDDRRIILINFQTDSNFQFL